VSCRQSVQFILRVNSFLKMIMPVPVKKSDGFARDAEAAGILGADD
jgi:hypothetical protein